MVFNFDNYFDFTPNETLEYSRDKMLTAVVNNRRDVRVMEREYSKCQNTLLLLEDNFIMDVFNLETKSFDNYTYNDCYRYYLNLWQEQVNVLSKKFKNIKINKKYFANQYKPVEKI